MKKRKVLRILIILLFVLVFVLVGYNEVNKIVAKERVVTFLNGYQQQDTTIGKLLLGTTETDSMSFEGVSAYFADELEYEIISCRREKKNVYNVEVKVQTIDFEQVFSDAYQTTIERYGEEGVAENFLNDMEQNIQAKEYELNKVTCNIIVRKLNNEFKIQMDSSFANALTGGMNEYLSSLQGGQ